MEENTSRAFLNKVDVIVTKHPALVQYLREQGICDERVPVLEHVQDPTQIRGLRVCGVLPLHLASTTNKIVQIPLSLTLEDRKAGELTIERLREIAGKPVGYFVIQIAGLPW
jgi:hypothetical protein